MWGWVLTCQEALVRDPLARRVKFKRGYLIERKIYVAGVRKKGEREKGWEEGRREERR